MTKNSATRLLELVELRKRLAEVRLIGISAELVSLKEQMSDLGNCESEDWRLADIVVSSKVGAARKLAARISEKIADENEASRLVSKAELSVEIASRIERETALVLERQDEDAQIEDLTQLAVCRGGEVH